MPTPKPLPKPIADTAPEAPLTPLSVDPGTIPVPTPDGTMVSPQVGHPEGVEPGSSGALAEPVGTPLTTPAHVQPEGADLHVDNSTETQQSPLATTVVDPVHTLAHYLASSHPAEALPGEHPATTAVRLLTRYAATGHQARCTESYCNRPAGHGGEHGWVHVER